MLVNFLRIQVGLEKLELKILVTLYLINPREAESLRRLDHDRGMKQTD